MTGVRASGLERRRSRSMSLGRPAIRTIATTENWVTWILKLLVLVPGLKPLINDLLINLAATSARPRPLPYSLWGPPVPPDQLPAEAESANYVAWPGLVDRTFTGRRLSQCDDAFLDKLRKPAALAPLFERESSMIESANSTALFCFFAQWFTDSFLRTDPNDFRRNTSNQEIDLCQIYGLCESDTWLLRQGEGGRLKSIMVDREEYPPRLFDPSGTRVAPEFEGLSYINPSTGTYRNADVLAGFDEPDRRRQLFASGLERGNSTIFYCALSTVFLREHNRLCRSIAEAHPQFDDSRIFESARNTNISLLLKVIIEDYVNHLSSAPVPFFLDIGKAEQKNWYRTNRISAEFDILYRWHSLTPDTMQLGGQTVDARKFRFHNDTLLKRGPASVLADIAGQPAGEISLRNSPAFLVQADVAAVEKSRAWRLRGYNDYRSAFGLPRLDTLLQLTRDRDLAARLGTYYEHIDDVELLIGLLAEARADGAVLGELMRLMVGVDAFSQALTNPLLSANIYGAETFTSVGLGWIERTHCLNDIAQRNLALDGRRLSFGRL